MVDPGRSGGRSVLPLAAVVMWSCVIVLWVHGCSLMVGQPIEGGGVGSPCRSSDDCHLSVCSGGLCVSACEVDRDCESPSICWQGECHLPLRVTAFYDGQVAEGEGWTYGHDAALRSVAAELGYVRLQTTESLNASTIVEPMETAIAAGAQVVIATSLSLEEPVVVAAERHPDVHFMVATASTWLARSNLTTYQGRTETAFHVGGMVAAQKAVHRIGIIMTTPHPRVLAEANAFALGVLRQRPAIKIEVRWLGFWLDYHTTRTFGDGSELLFLEELLTKQFIESGCEVVVQLGDTGRSARYIESKLALGQAPTTYSLMRNDKDGWRDPLTGDPMRTCLGSVFYDWTPRYREVLDGIHRFSWTGQGIIDQLASEAPVIGVALNPTMGVDDTSVRTAINELAGLEGIAKVFEGPYEVTGQRDADGDGNADAQQRVAPGETLSEEELARMCWFVKGMVEKDDPADPTSLDRDARAPDGSFAPPKDFVAPPGMEGADAFDCHAYL